MGIYTDAVQKLYVSYVNRPAEPAGLAYWESQIAAQNGNTEVLARAFATSSEFLGYNEGLTTAEIVNFVYLNLFGRAAEDSGLQYWVGMLDGKKVTIDNVVTEIGSSAKSWDLQAFNAKIEAAKVFTTALDSAGEIQSYIGEGANTIARNYLAGVVDSASLESARQHIAETIDKLQFIDDSPFNNHRLRLGPDHITGGAGLDRFIGGSNGNGLTFSHDDVLDGGEGLDLLAIDIANNQPFVTPANVSVKNIEAISISGANTTKIDTTDWSGVTSLTVNGKGDSTLKASASSKIDATLSLKAATLNVDGGHDINLKLSDVALVTDTPSHTHTDVPYVFVGKNTPATGSVNITSDGPVPANGAAIGGKINVVGGTSVNITQIESGTRNYFVRMASDVTVTGTDITTSVSVNSLRALMPYRDDEKVLISDLHAGSATQLGTINKVEISGHNYTEIRDNALSQLVVTDVVGNVVISNAGLTQGAVQTLALSLENVDASISDNNVYSTVNLSLPHGATSNNSTLHALTGTALNTLAVVGDGRLQLAENFNSANLALIQTSGKAALTANSLQNLSALAKVDLSASTGENLITIDATRTSFIGGNGIDRLVATNSNISRTIDLGAGDDSLALTYQAGLPTALVNAGAGTDILAMTWDQVKTIAGDAGFASVFQNFETLWINGAGTARTVDLATLPGFTGVAMTDGTVTNLPNNGMLRANASTDSQFKIDSPDFVAGSNDSVTLDVHTFGFSSAKIAAANVEHLIVKASDDSGYTAVANININDLAAQSIKLSGTISSDIVLNSTALTQVDAREFNGTKLTLSTASAQTALTVLGGNSNTTMDFSKYGGNLSFTGGSGNDRITLGAGANSVTVGTGGDIINLSAAGKDSNTFTTILDAHRGLRVGLPEMGHVTFAASKLTLDSAATLQNYFDSVIVTRGNAAQDAAGAWFQFQDNTYIVQSRHDAAQVAHFVNGTDFIVKLTGLIDLSNAHLTPNNVLTIV